MIDRLYGHYRTLSVLGQGGMGIVFRARDEVLQRDVALKFVGDNVDAGARKALFREARAASALSHPNICTVHAVAEGDGEVYIVMELVEGQPLNGAAGSEGLPYQTVLRYGVQIAAALTHAHARNVIHRDLKGSNVMITPDGLVKVLDFGLARRVVTSTGTHAAGTWTMDSKDTYAGTGGTLAYMAPEVLCGEPGDQRSDLWALGVVLYEALTGRPPFTGRTTFELSSAILHADVPSLPPHVPAGLVAVVLRCLAKDPAARYQQAGEVMAVLEALQSANAAPPPKEEARGQRTFLHRGTKHVDARAGDVLLLVGTTKGVFVMRARRDRTRWDTAGPYFHGQAAYALAWDGRQGRHRIWAASSSMIWGAFLRFSDDFGRTWTDPIEAPIAFPANSGAALKNIWQITPGRESEPDVLYCGVEPAALFKSVDDGTSWSLVRGLFDHPHRARWIPGFGGLSLHTILLDPNDINRMYVAISAGGVYGTEDGGETWRPRNRGLRVTHSPERYPEFGQCIHRVVMHPSRPERLFLQNHWGVYRSEDWGESWQDIARDLPSDFGFAMGMHPRNPDMVYVLPVESDEFRCTPDGRVRVYRTRNGGGSWEAMTRGLPQKGAYETVLREGLSVDSHDPAGVYFGTRSGQIYASIDEGRSWKRIADGLPPVTCVRAVVVEGGNKSARPGGAARKPVATATKKKKPSAVKGKASAGTKKTRRGK